MDQWPDPARQRRHVLTNRSEPSHLSARRSTMKQVVLVTGVSSGFGLLSASIALAEPQDRVRDGRRRLALRKVSDRVQDLPLVAAGEEPFAPG